jgi:hypothetical protein
VNSQLTKAPMALILDLPPPRLYAFRARPEDKMSLASWAQRRIVHALIHSATIHGSRQTDSFDLPAHRARRDSALEETKTVVATELPHARVLHARAIA